MSHHEYYPCTYVLPGGKLFIAAPHMPTQRFSWSAVSNSSRSHITGERSSAASGTSVLFPLRPPGYVPRALIAGGDLATAQQTAECIYLSVARPAWEALANLTCLASSVNSVLLPHASVMSPADRRTNAVRPRSSIRAIPPPARCWRSR